MGVVRPPAEHDFQVAEYRKARDEAALYIATLSRKFEDSGLSLHEILGKSLATSERLAELPKSLQLAQLPVIEGLTLNVIKEIGQRAELLQAAWEKASSASALWKGVQVSSLSRFDVDEIFELAKQLAEWLDRLDIKLREAKGLGLVWADIRNNLPSLVRVLDNALAIGDQQCAAAAARIAAASATKDLRDFIAGHRKVQTIEAQLSPILASEISEATCQAVSEIEALCAQYKIESLASDALVESVASKGRTIEAVRKLVAQMRPFAELVPESENWRFSDVGKLRQVIAEVGKDALYNRSQALAEPSAASGLKRLITMGRQLLREREALAEHFGLTERVSTEQLQESSSALREAGFFRLFNPSYRRAKRLYLRVARKEFSRKEAAAQLDRLALFKGQESSFCRDAQANSLLGAQFRGLETEFDVFNRVAEFYEAVREKFAGLDQKSLRDFLVSGDVELLLQVPALDFYPEGLRLKTLEENLATIESDAAAAQQAFVRVRELSRLFVSAEKVEIGSLSEIKKAITVALS